MAYDRLPTSDDDAPSSTVAIHLSLNDSPVDWSKEVPPLPPAILDTVFSYCSETAAAGLSKVSILCKARYDKLYKPSPQLLQVTAKSDTEAVMKMIRTNPDLILRKSQFTEEWCGQRKWDQGVSALEYAAWTGDSPTVDCLLEHVLDKAEALQQLKEVRQNGTEHGPHLSAFKKLSEEYKAFITHFNTTHPNQPYASSDGVKNWNESARRWRTIGKQQLRSGAHFMLLFCSKRPFNNANYFKEPPDKELTVDHLLAADSVLTADPAITCLTLLKTDSNYCLTGRPPGINDDRLTCVAPVVQNNFRAVETFIEVRTNDLDRQIARLERELTQEQNNYCCCRMM